MKNESRATYPLEYRLMPSSWILDDFHDDDSICCYLSWKFPVHVPRMGTCPKILGTESDGRPFFAEFAQSHVHSVDMESVTCPHFRL